MLKTAAHCIRSESNLKTVSALPETLALSTPALLGAARHRIECELPNANMHNFEGVLYLGGAHSNFNADSDANSSASASGSDGGGGSGLALTKDQILLRGSSLQNTGIVFGVCIGAGAQTKLFLNSNEPPYKRSQVEQIMNQQVRADPATIHV
jgi:phospholipid-transporting ATPase